MARFHSLDVTDVRRETRDAVVVTLRPQPEDAALFDFTQGQYLTFRRNFDGDELRRSYSICAGRGEGHLQVGIKRVDGGAFSTWANEELKPGDRHRGDAADGPLPRPDRARRRPSPTSASPAAPASRRLLSIIKTVLAAEPRSTFTLVYANRQISSIMFREELEDLKNRYLGRLSVLHVLESEAQEIDLFTGRVDAAKMRRAVPRLDRRRLGRRRLHLRPRADDAGHRRRAAGARPRRRPDQVRALRLRPARPRQAARRQQGRRHLATRPPRPRVTLDGATRSFRMPKDGTSLLDAALENHLDAPYACKAGVCSTCRARVLEGEVEMAANHALEDYEVRQGYVLTCQCFPLSDKLVVSYDQ